jgi:hypothetical protein
VILEQRRRQPGQRRLGLVDEDERTRAEARQPRAELRADRPRRPGDEDGRARDVAAGGVAVTDGEDWAAEKPLDGDVVDAG